MPCASHTPSVSTTSVSGNPGIVPWFGTLTGSVSPRSLKTASMQSIASSSSLMPPRERPGSSSGRSLRACST